MGCVVMPACRRSTVENHQQASWLLSDAPAFSGRIALFVEKTGDFFLNFWKSIDFNLAFRI